MNLTKAPMKALFAAALCAGLAACSTTDTTSTMDSSGASMNSSTGSSDMRSPQVWDQSGNTPSTATPGTSPSAPSNADDNSVKR